MTPPRFIISNDYADFLKPGFLVELDQDEADDLGAFVEDAISIEDAIDSNLDMEDAANG